jgi:predicted DsbA family dithiol-disulfide isomerase
MSSAPHSSPATPLSDAEAPQPALQIDFVSDVVCPWCAIGLHSLLMALDKVKDEIGPVSLQFQPFQLNPDMGPAGEDIVAYLSAKYGMAPEQVVANQAGIRERAASVGFDMRMDRRSRTWNTFHAHRLLEWAGQQSEAAALALKKALFKAYFTDGENPASPQVLHRAAAEAGLDPEQAAAVIFDTDAHADEVRQALAYWQQAGIQSVPAVIINRRHLISGGQPPEVFEQALRRIALAGAEAAP